MEHVVILDENLSKNNVMIQINDHHSYFTKSNAIKLAYEILYKTTN